MEVTFKIVDYGEEAWTPTVKVGNGSFDDEYRRFSVNLCETFERLRDEAVESDGELPPMEFVSLFHKRETPDWYDGTPFRFLEQTVWGQYILEKALVDHGVRYSLDLLPAKIYVPNRVSLGDKEKWEDIPEPEINATERFLEEVDTADDVYIYTLRLVDHESDTELFYVGRSTQIMHRLKKHVRSGGDFSTSTEKTSVHEIVSIKPKQEVTEEEQYRIVERRVNAPVHGGR
jgi:hypothetical protein